MLDSRHMMNTGTQLPFVSVIVPTYNDWTRTKQCLDALLSQNYPRTKYEVLVIDNNVAPPTDLDLYNYIGKSAKLLTEAKKGSYAARNTGIRAAKGDILAFTDSDCIPSPDWLSQGIRHFQTNDNLSAVAGHISLFTTEKIKTCADCLELATAFDQKQSVARGTAVTANLFIKKETIEKQGLFDENVPSGGDTLYTKQLTTQGYLLAYAEDAVVHHPSRSELSELTRKARRKYGARLARQNTLWGKIYYGITLFYPPATKLKRIFDCKHLTVTEKMQALYAILLTRVGELYEWARITIKGKEPLR